MTEEIKNTRVIAVSNQKGGVGKTTTTANLAFALAKEGRDVLLIDFDSQASLTNYLNVGLDEEEYFGTYEMMLRALTDDTGYPELDELDLRTEEGWAKLFEMCICRPKYADRRVVIKENGKRAFEDYDVEFGVDLLASHLMLSDYELLLNRPEYTKNKVSGLRLYSVIQKLIRWHPYDYIFIDTNPSLGVMSMNAIAAATSGTLIPTNLDLMSTRGVAALVDRISDVQEQMLSMPQPIVHMGVIGILLNLYSDRRKVDTTIQNDINRFYPFKIFKETIPESSDAKKAVLAGLIYSQFNKKAAAQYAAVARELEEQLTCMETEGQRIRRIGESV